MDSHSKGLVKKTTVDEAVLLGTGAVEAAFQLGTVQTSEIVTARYEIEKLRKDIASIKKDRGMSVGYMSPEEVEKMKVQWNDEIRLREGKIKRLKNQLEVLKKSNSSKHNTSKGETYQIAMVDELQPKLQSLQAERDKLKDKNRSQQTHPKDPETVLRSRIVELERKNKGRSQQIQFLLEKIGSLGAQG